MYIPAGGVEKQGPIEIAGSLWSAAAYHQSLDDYLNT